MPRLSDLLPENLKKQLAAETRKTAPLPLPEKQLPSHAPVKTAASLPVTPVPDFVAIDVETTGLDFSSDRVIEVGAVRFSQGRPCGEFSTLVNPGVPVPAVITDLTGIADADVATAPGFADSAQKFLEFIGDLPLCGHQIMFDLTFLNKELERCGRQPIGKQSLDTALLSRILLQSGTRFSLKSVSDKLAVELTNAHRALADAKASGEVASLLVPKLAQLPLHVRQTMAAAAPGSFLKTLIYQSLGGARPGVSVRVQPGPAAAAKLSVPETFRAIDVEEIKAIFSSGGRLAEEMPSFVLRDSQRAMAVEAAEAFNTQSILLAEAGTGTGKSLAYLVPAALWALANNTSVAVATRTRNLQDQLTAKELPLVAKIAGGKFRYSVLKGRANYVCLNKWRRLLLGEAGNLSIRERFAILPLVPWVESTLTGDIEEQNQFNPKWFQKVWDLISSESHGCEGRRCPFFKSCFLQQARQQAQCSQIIVINHALFFSEIGRADSFLAKVSSLVFDEAHHLESSGHKHLRVELDTNRTSLFLEQINNLSQRLGDLRETDPLAVHSSELKSLVKRVRKQSHAFLDSVIAWAAAKRQGAAAGGEYQVPLKSGDLAQDIEAPAFANTLDAFKDRLYQLKQDLAGGSLPSKLLDLLREEVPFCQEQSSQLAADLAYLVAAQTEGHAFWVEGNAEKGWVKLCGVPLDVAGLLSSLWADRAGALLFTSATLSVARSVDYFFNAVGLGPHQARTAVRFFPTPFTKDQAFVGAVKNAPDPDDREFPSYVASAVAELHVAFKKNILVLFTANAMLAEVYKRLHADTRLARQSVLAQNISGGRHALLEQFKRNGEMVLLGTDSFWEGIDVPGEACEIVVIPRLPFPVPTHPLTMAIAEKMAMEHGESFMSYAVPEAVIRFRQGCGRLIRTAQDRGALIVLDNRIVNKGYGKQFIRSLETDFRTFDDKNDMLGRIKGFFEDAAQGAVPSGISYVPFDEV
jgi:ATP-dependent DNA helicase DinG